MSASQQKRNRELAEQLRNRGIGLEQAVKREREAWDSVAQREKEIAQLERARKRLCVALQHILAVTNDPCKYGRYLTEDDREIIRDALKAAYVPNAEVSHRDPTAAAGKQEELTK